MARRDGFPNPETFRMGAAGHGFAPIWRRPSLIALDPSGHSAASQMGLRSLEFVQRMHGPPMRYPTPTLTLIARLRRPPPTLLSRRWAAPPDRSTIRRASEQPHAPLDSLAPLSIDSTAPPAWEVAPITWLSASPSSRDLVRLVASRPSIQRWSGNIPLAGGAEPSPNPGFDQPATPALLFVQPQPTNIAQTSGHRQPTPRASRLRTADRAIGLVPTLTLVQPQRMSIGALAARRWSSGWPDQGDRIASPVQSLPTNLILVQPQRGAPEADNDPTSARRVDGAQVQRITRAAQPISGASLDPSQSGSTGSGPTRRMLPGDSPLVQRIGQAHLATVDPSAFQHPAASPTAHAAVAPVVPRYSADVRLAFRVPQPPDGLQHALAGSGATEPGGRSSAALRGNAPPLAVGTDADPTSTQVQRITRLAQSISGAPQDPSQSGSTGSGPTRRMLLGDSPLVQRIGQAHLATVDPSAFQHPAGSLAAHAAVAPVVPRYSADVRLAFRVPQPPDGLQYALAGSRATEPGGRSSAADPASGRAASPAPLQRAAPIWLQPLRQQQAGPAASPQPARRPTAGPALLPTRPATFAQQVVQRAPLISTAAAAQAGASLIAARLESGAGMLQRRSASAQGSAGSASQQPGSSSTLEWLTPGLSVSAAATAATLRRQPSPGLLGSAEATPTRQPARPILVNAHAAAPAVAEVPFGAGTGRKSGTMAQSEAGFSARLEQRLGRVAVAPTNAGGESRLMLHRPGAPYPPLPASLATLRQPIGGSMSPALSATLPLSRAVQPSGATRPGGPLPLLRRYLASPQLRQPVDVHPGTSAPGASARSWGDPGQRSIDPGTPLSGSVINQTQITTSPALSSAQPLTTQRMGGSDHPRSGEGIEAVGAEPSTVLQRWPARTDRTGALLLLLPGQSHISPLAKAERVPGSGRPTSAAAPLQRFGAAVGHRFRTSLPVRSLEGEQPERWHAHTATLQRDPQRAPGQFGMLDFIAPRSFAASQMASPLLQRLSRLDFRGWPARLPDESTSRGTDPAQRSGSVWQPESALTWLSGGWGQESSGRPVVQRQLAERLIERANRFPSSAAMATVAGLTPASPQRAGPAAGGTPFQAQAQTGQALTTIQPLRSLAWLDTISELQRMPTDQWTARTAVAGPGQSALFKAAGRSPFNRPDSTTGHGRLLQPIAHALRIGPAIHRHTHATPPASSPAQGHAVTSRAGWSWIVRRTGSALEAGRPPGETGVRLRPLTLLQRTLAAAHATFGAAAGPEDQTRRYQPGWQSSALPPTTPPSTAGHAGSDWKSAPGANLASSLIRRFPQGVSDQTARTAEQSASSRIAHLALVEPRATPTVSVGQPWSDDSAGDRPAVLAQRAVDSSLDLLQPARTSQPGQTPLQRVLSDNSLPEAGVGSSSSASQPTDIEALARQVYSRLRRRLRIEAERLGK